ncbi:MAG: peptidylprolyl isomerase [Desulfobulbaceae bacterium]|nr:peptidylprolyl isomerase [Desulfobulbaceae bacterium]
MFFRTVVFFIMMAALPLSAHAEPGAGTKEPTATFETSLGKIVIELFPDKAPVTVANFRRHVREKFYDNLIFHRVINGFVIQGGGFEPGMKPRMSPYPAIANEAANGLINQRGTLSMARTAVVDSATSQFFINLQDNPALDHQGKTPSRYGYAVFGRVVEGMEVVDAIARLATTAKGIYQDVPVKDAVILKAYENK